ncbi:MAG: AraC family transcriptional regulator [Trebonia sp.]
MPVRRQPPPPGPTSRLWPSGGAHLWPSGGTSQAQSHPRGHLVYAARGVLSVHTERGTSIVPANRVAWTPAGFTHHHRAHGHTEMRIEFLPASLARLLPGHPAVFTASGLAREILLTLTGPRNWDRPARDYDRPARDWDRSARARLRRVLADELREAPEQPLQLPEPHDDRLQAVARRLYEQPADNTSLAELGQATGASARTLSRLFRNELGMTFYQWRTQLRIYHALVLLADGHDATRVAHACGWANPSSFIVAFTSIIGTTPGRYRTGDLIR